MRLNPYMFTGMKAEEYPQGFIDELEKIFRVMHVNEVEGVELAAYQLKDMANQWYNEWKDLKGSDVEPSSSRYAPELAGNMRARMRKFASDLSNDLVLECKGAMLNREMDFFQIIHSCTTGQREEEKVGRGHILIAEIIGGTIWKGASMVKENVILVAIQVISRRFAPLLEGVLGVLGHKLTPQPCHHHHHHLRELLQLLYALYNRQDAEASPDVVKGTLQFFSCNVYVLLDPGSTLSYVTPFVAVSSGFEPKIILEPVSVSTPISDSVMAKRMYQNCVMPIGNRDTMADLVKIDMIEFDAILEMDWHHSYYATLDCRTRRVTFSFLNEPVIEWEGYSLAPKGNFISYLRAYKLISKEGFVVYCDASQVGLGYVLMQHVKEKQAEDPILFQIKNDVGQQKVMAFEISGDGILRYQVKVEHLRLGGTSQEIALPMWKWEMINMDFTMGLSKSWNQYDSIWVIVDQMTMSSYFMPVRIKFSGDDYAKMYVKEIVHLHRSPVSIISDRFQKLRSKEIASVKVLWKNQKNEEATWESEDDMRAKYPTLFEAMDNGIEDEMGARAFMVQNSRHRQGPDSGREMFRSSSLRYDSVVGFHSRRQLASGATGNGLCQVLVAVFFGDLVDSFGLNRTSNVLQEVSKVSLRLVYLAIGSGVAAMLQVACWTVTAERQAARLRVLYLKSILRQDVTFFDKEVNTGEVIGKMSGDIFIIQDAMGDKVGKLIRCISMFIGGFIIAFIKGWLLALVMLTPIVPLVLVVGVMFIFMSRQASQSQKAYSEAANVVEQTIGSIRTVASFTGEKQAIEEYNKSLQKAYRYGVHEGLASGLGLGSAYFILFCNYALAFWYGGKMILEKGYTGGSVLSITLALLNASMSIGEASPCLAAFTAGQAAASKMFETINRNPEIDVYNNSGIILDDIRGDIEIKDVHFGYPSRPKERVLNEFSLLIPSGKSTALVGGSGSGKSTIISLIERFYDPQSGGIFIDGCNLKDFQVKWIRQKIALVSQEPTLFSTSIRENVAYGKDGATKEEIEAAIEIANATKFINSLPEGIETNVGERGTQLSGGQKQRIAIARAILKDPRILLLDEATSALDAESESVVQEALDKIMVDRTTIIVAHRLSTVRNADNIAVIHQGTIVEEGKHFELLKDPEGAYSQLIRLQEVNQTKEQLCLDDSQHLYTESRPESSNNYDTTSIKGTPKTRLPRSSDTRLKVSKKLEKTHVTRLANLNKPEFPILLVGAVVATVSGSALPVSGLVYSNILKSFYEPPNELKKDTQFWSLMIVVIATTLLISSPLETFFFTVSGCKLVQRIRSMCFQKAIHMEIGWFDEPENSVGGIATKLSADAAIVRVLVGDTLAKITKDLAAAIVGTVIAFRASWFLSLIIIAMLPFMMANMYVQNKLAKGFGTEAKKYEKASRVVNDAVSNIRTVASFCVEEKVVELYKKESNGPIMAGTGQGMISGISYGITSSFILLVYAASAYAGARLVQDGKISITDTFREGISNLNCLDSSFSVPHPYRHDDLVDRFWVFLAVFLTAVVIARSSFINDFKKAKSASASIFYILDRESKIDLSKEDGLTLDQSKGVIEFKEVCFAYPTRPYMQVLHGFSLTISSGQTVALVGKSGCGKSTVISLLQRYYNFDSGQIMLDGIDIQDFNLKWLRHQMGLVNQEPVLFNDTIRANIMYGKEDGDATEGEVVAATKLANAHEFICGLQQGYDTMVGERGVQLSGGQKQRVAIARAIMKNPKILLLDEATSALDAESERIVQMALDQIMVNRTTIIVAHRLSTIKEAEILCVLKNGAIIEQGNHDTLITFGVLVREVVVHDLLFGKSSKILWVQLRDQASWTFLSLNRDPLQEQPVPSPSRHFSPRELFDGIILSLLRINFTVGSPMIPPPHLTIDEYDSFEDESSDVHPMDMEDHSIELNDPHFFQKEREECGLGSQPNKPSPMELIFM
ncbi:ABC transporter B family member 12 [Capsicum annuum]|nr:ABC transporter B family member 12 [Capsicum annuum]